MQKINVSYIGILADYDHGEGWIVIRWPHKYYGYEELTIDITGHCSRRMPLYSGQGPPEYVELTRDRLRLRFDAKLAAKLKLEEDVEFSFALSDEEFSELERWVEYWNGD